MDKEIPQSVRDFLDEYSRFMRPTWRGRVRSFFWKLRQKFWPRKKIIDTGFMKGETLSWTNSSGTHNARIIDIKGNVLTLDNGSEIQL